MIVLLRMRIVYIVVFIDRNEPLDGARSDLQWHETGRKKGWCWPGGRRNHSGRLHMVRMAAAVAGVRAPPATVRKWLTFDCCTDSAAARSSSDISDKSGVSVSPRSSKIPPR